MQILLLTYSHCQVKGTLGDHVWNLIEGMSVPRVEAVWYIDPVGDLAGSEYLQR